MKAENILLVIVLCGVIASLYIIFNGIKEKEKGDVIFGSICAIILALCGLYFFLPSLN